MINWYYVIGSERVGPVSESALKVLFMNDEINLETYIWRKGFQNWERIKDVNELNFNDLEEIEAETYEEEEAPAPVVEMRKPPKPQAPAKLSKEVTKEIPREVLQELNSPQVNFTFDWNKIKDNDELFFVKIGKDRKDSAGADMYGPYSLVELTEALEQKRINQQTLIFAPGMNSWTKVQETIINKNLRNLTPGLISLSEAPLMLVFNDSPLPLITLVKKAGTKEGVLLGSGPFGNFQNKTVPATLYVGSEMKVRNIQVKINGYDKKAQTMDCQFIDLDQDARKIMLNHAV